MKFKIKSLRVEDFPQFYKFAKNFIITQFLDYPPPVRRFYWKKEFNPRDLKEAIKKKRKLVLVALCFGKITGFTILEFDLGGGVHLSWTGVDKKFRKQGIGSSLLKKTQEEAAARLCHFIYLWTENKNNVKFYQKRGFYLVGVQKKSWCGIDEYLLQKNIGEPAPKLWKNRFEG